MTERDLSRPVFSRLYARVSRQMEAEGMADLRRELLAGVHGEVVEVGAGNGLNFGHYPVGLRKVTAIEPERRLRELARQAGERASVPVEVRPGTAERLPLPDSSADFAVLCLTLCSIRDRPRALIELQRVLRPGGTLCFLEHTRATTPALRTAQRIADATVWPLIAGGCHTGIDVPRLIGAAGYTITTMRRLRFPERGPATPTSPHVLGAAVRD